MITIDNFSRIESTLNSELKKESGYEDWMYFSVTLIKGTFIVGYLLPSSHGVTTNKTLKESLAIYNSVVSRVLS